PRAVRPRRSASRPSPATHTARRPARRSARGLYGGARVHGPEPLDHRPDARPRSAARRALPRTRRIGRPERDRAVVAARDGICATRRPGFGGSTATARGCTLDPFLRALAGGPPGNWAPN